MGAENSEEHIHLLDSNVDTAVLTLGRSWSKKNKPGLNWKDNSMVRAREDGTKLRILPETVDARKGTIIMRLFLKKMVKEMKRGK